MDRLCTIEGSVVMYTIFPVAGFSMNPEHPRRFPFTRMFFRWMLKFPSLLTRFRSATLDIPVWYDICFILWFGLFM